LLKLAIEPGPNRPRVSGICLDIVEGETHQRSSDAFCHGLDFRPPPIRLTAEPSGSAGWILDGHAGRTSLVRPREGWIRGASTPRLRIPPPGDEEGMESGAATAREGHSMPTILRIYE
jgi:hypothetical protein